METSTKATFSILNFVEQLTPTKQKNKYHCPVCNGNDLSIEPNTGKYTCYHGCERRDIREALKPWSEVIEERKGGNNDFIPKRKPQVKPSEPGPVPLPKGIFEIAKLNCRATDSPKPELQKSVAKCVKTALSKKGATEEEIKRVTKITYEYGDGKSAHRFECRCEASDKGHEKTFSISRLDKNGQVLWNKGGVPWNFYRQEEAINAMLRVDEKFIPILLSHEGEKKVELSRGEGIAGITSVGGATEEELIRNFERLKFEMGDREFIVAHCQDNDKAGIEKSQKLSRAAAIAKVPFIIIDLTKIKPDLCDKGGVDDLLETGMTGEELEILLLKQIQLIRGEERESVNTATQSEDRDTVLPDDYDPETEFLQRADKTLFGDKPWICVQNKLYFWDGNHYKHSSDGAQLKRIRNFCNRYEVPTKDGMKYPYANPNKVKQVMDWVKMGTHVDIEEVNPPGLNCVNGVLQIIWFEGKPSWKLIDHTPDLYYLYEPIAIYDPNADNEFCDKLLDCLDSSQQEVFLRTIAASLDLKTVRKYKGRLKALLLKGDGNNGKDSLREVVALMYGKVGITSCSLADFANYDAGRKFALSALWNSRINWSSENTNADRLDRIQSLKAFITGDPLISERKGVDGEEFEPSGVGLFNVNDTPKLQGTLEAISSRLAVLTFSKTFKQNADPAKGEIEADPRYKYDPEFVRTKVVPAFLNRVLASLVSLSQEGINYNCTQQALENIQIENCHLFQFCQDVGINYKPDATITAGEIWELLEGWYQDNGTLTYEEGANGKRKGIWIDQPNRNDSNVKGANQILARFKTLFPKAKVVTVSTGKGGKPRMALQGIGIDLHPTSHSISENLHPICTQSCTLESVQNKDSHPLHSISNIGVENQKSTLDCESEISIPMTSSIDREDTGNFSNLGAVSEDVQQVRISDTQQGAELGSDMSAESKKQGAELGKSKSKSNIEHLPIPDGPELTIGVKVWAYELRTRQWVKAEITHINLDAKGNIYNFEVRTFVGGVLTVYLQNLRLRQ